MMRFRNTSLRRPIAGVLVATSLSLPAVCQEELYAFSVGNGFEVIDPSGQFLRTVPITGNPFINGMAYDGTSLAAIDIGQAGSPLDSTVRSHPADGVIHVMGATGFNWNLAAFGYDALSGRHYAIYGDEVFLVDMTTGVPSSVGYLSGLKAFDAIFALAIDSSSGAAYGLGAYMNGAVGPAVYRLDLTTLSAQNLGPTDMGGIGGFRAAAIDRYGQLWASWSSWSSPALNDSGIFIIHLGSLTPIHVVKTLRGYTGLAFVPRTPRLSYCTGKTNSLGCVPSTASVGYASPNASTGFDVLATSVRNNTIGMFVYSTSGRTSRPFSGGTLCIAPPHRRTGIVSSGGNSARTRDCSGVWTMDFNEHVAQRPGPTPGTVVNGQWYGRDPGLPPRMGGSLSDGLEFTLLP